MEASAQALQDLKAFNRMVAGHPMLSARLIRGEHHHLQWQQASLFLAWRAYRARPPGTPWAPARRTTFRMSVSVSVARALTACATLTRKADVLVFGVDKIAAPSGRDFRIEGLYRFLEDRRIPYVDAFHTRLGRAFYRNAWIRRRCAIYHEALVFSASPRPGSDDLRIAASLPCDGFAAADRPFVRALAETALRRAVASPSVVRRYARILARLRPRAILAIDDTRYYHELVAAARTLGIPSYAFQHGHFTKYHAGWLKADAGPGDDIRPDRLFVWSPYWKKELLRLGTNFKEEEIAVGGDPKGGAPKPEAAPYAPPHESGRIELLVPFESDAPHGEIAKALASILATGRVKIWLKTRPDWDKESQLRAYGFAESDPSRVEAIDDPARVRKGVHAVVGVFTSYLYEAVAMRKPVFVLKTSHDGGEGMIVNGLADAFDAAGPDAVDRLISACRAAAPKLESRAETYLRGMGDLTTTLEALLPEA